MNRHIISIAAAFALITLTGCVTGAPEDNDSDVLDAAEQVGEEENDDDFGSDVEDEIEDEQDEDEIEAVDFLAQAMATLLTNWKYLCWPLGYALILKENSLTAVSIYWHGQTN